MKVKFLLSFQNEKEVQNLDEDFINSISDFFVKNYSKKAKKKVIKPISKSNLLKNNKLQSSKNKVENKMNLILNKLSKNNFDDLVKEFITTFTELNQTDYDIILKTTYMKILKDEKFLGLFFKFYSLINNIYRTLFNLSNKYFIELVEMKIKYDYVNFKLDDDFTFLSKFTKEEHRINNLNLIILLIESNNFKSEIINEVSNLIINTDNIPDIYFWFRNKLVISKDIFSNYTDKLTSKLDNDMNNRYSILLKNLLDCNDIEYESEEEDESICSLNISDDENKSNFEIEIDNIIEEFLLLEDFEEIKSFIDNFNDKDKTIKIFMSTLLNFYFNNNLSNYSKFKKLFVNLKKSKLVKSDIFKTTLMELLSDEGKYDYINLNTKIDKIIDIYKIVQIKISKEYIKELKST